MDRLAQARAFRTRLVGPELTDPTLAGDSAKVDNPLAAQLAAVTALLDATLDALARTIDVDAVRATAASGAVDRELVAKVAGAVGWSWAEADRIRSEHPDKWAAVLADLRLGGR